MALFHYLQIQSVGGSFTIDKRNGLLSAQREDKVLLQSSPSQMPSVSWSLDQTAAGSNLFRSTKENIYSAIPSNASGDKLSVISNGTQHTRSWIEGDAIRLLVADYNNAGNENFLISHAEKEYRPLKKGDRIAGEVRLRF